MPLYSVFFLWSQNVNKVDLADVIPPLLAVLAGTAAVFGACWVVLRRDTHRAAFVTTLWGILFFAYGHVAAVLRSRNILGAFTTDDLYLVGAWGVLGLAAAAIVVLRRADWSRFNVSLNVIVGALLAYSLVAVVAGSLRQSGGPEPALEPIAVDAASAKGTKRDIYYLIFDRYAGPRTLERYYGFDNEPFLDELRDRGFVIPNKARGNYPKTPHSLGTSLNMDYVDHLPPDSGDWRKVYALLPQNRVARFLKAQGYEYVFVSSKYDALRDDPIADRRVSYEPKIGIAWNDFTQQLYLSTFLPALASVLRIDRFDPRVADHERTLFQFERLAGIRRIAAPTYTFAHFNLPHDPFVFDAEGRFVSGEQERRTPIADAYLGQVRFANRKILELIDELTSVPKDERPIIIVQADEGPGPAGWDPDVPGHFDWTSASQQTLDEKFELMSAYLLPGADEGAIYDEMSPVNSFRVVFNTYFGTDLPILRDRSYVFPNELHPYRFIDVTERVRE